MFITFDMKHMFQPRTYSSSAAFVQIIEHYVNVLTNERVGGGSEVALSPPSDTHRRFNGNAAAPIEI
jgi:hypothetical protein